MTSEGKKWGLVLSGGAAFGFANAGVLQVLEREHLRPDYIAGSSMGAIIGALYALGYSAADITDLCKQTSLFDMVRLNPRPFKGGLRSGIVRHAFRGHLASMLDGKRIRDCVIPFVCIAGHEKEPVDWTRILQKDFTAYVTERIEPHTFPDDTLILDAIMASSAVPVMFQPVTVAGKTYIDLCNFGTIPARTMRTQFQPDIVIATDTAPRHRLLSRFLPPSWNAFMIASETYLEESRSACDLVITPQLKGGMWRFDLADRYIDAGRSAAEKAVAEIRRLVG